MKIQLEKGLLAVLLTLLVACTSIGLAPAQNVSQRINYAYGTTTAVVNAALEARGRGALDDADRDFTVEMAKDVRSVLKAADIASKSGDVKTAEGRLTLALSTLTQLQTYLNSKGVDHGR